MLRSLAERLGGIIPSGAAKSKRRDGASSATDYASIPTQEKTEPPPPADPSRPLSATEAAFVYLRMSMVTVVALSGPIDAALIGKAIELLRQKHPYLSLALVPDFFAPGHLRFVVARDALLDYRIVPVVRHSVHRVALRSALTHTLRRTPHALGSRWWRRKLRCSGSGAPLVCRGG